MGVKCLAQEHNTVPRPGLEPGPFDPESKCAVRQTSNENEKIINYVGDLF